MRTIFPGQRVVTSDGTVRTVAFLTPSGQVFVWAPTGVPVPARILHEAWGGDGDLFLLQPLASRSNAKRPRLSYATTRGRPPALSSATLHPRAA